LRPIIPPERPIVPPEFEDTLDTVPEVQIRKRQPVIPMIWVTVFLGIFSILAVGVAFGLSNFRVGQQAVLTGSPTGLPITMPTSTAPLSYPPPPIESPTTAFTATNTPTETATSIPTATFTSMPTETPMLAASPFLSDRFICIADVTADRGSLSQVLQSFDVEYKPDATYNRCTSLRMDLMRCEKSEVIVNHKVVQPGEWIIVPVAGQQACSGEQGGKWVGLLSQ